MTQMPPGTSAGIPMQSERVDSRSVHTASNNMSCEPFPQHLGAQRTQLVTTFDEGQEVVSGELSHRAREAARPVSGDDPGLAMAAG